MKVMPAHPGKLRSTQTPEAALTSRICESHFSMFSSDFCTVMSYTNIIPWSHHKKRKRDIISSPSRFLRTLAIACDAVQLSGMQQTTFPKINFCQNNQWRKTKLAQLSPSYQCTQFRNFSVPFSAPFLNSKFKFRQSSHTQNRVIPIHN